MKKRHDYPALLRYMGMLEDGYTIEYIHKKYGIGKERLKNLRYHYQKVGSSALCRKKHIRVAGALRQQIVSEVRENKLTLFESSLQFGVCTDQLRKWLKTAKEEGMQALLITKKRGWPKGMGRPKKQEPQTELEKLREENEVLRIENALLKKVKALVEERDARLRAIGRGQSEN